MTQAPPGTDAPLEPNVDDDAWKRRFRRRLLAWFALHRRDLPWRRTRDPYRVWISEIMLQQTQVATVIPYYERFLAAFPDVHALAAAPEHDVLKLWEGLGYYRRARQLHRAARVLLATHGGVFPRDLDAVRELPGIGRYTAGAILSIAFDLPAPILEANTVRLFTRLLAYQGDPASTAGQRLLWQAAEALLPRKQTGEFNQALMELGSLICTPRAPACDSCPVPLLCGARLQSLVEELPRMRAKVAITPVREAAIVIRRGSRIFISQQAEGRRWAGLWDFPRFSLVSEHEAGVHDEIVTRTRELTGMTIEPGDHLATLKHGVTRFRITLDCYAAKVVAGGPKKSLHDHSGWVLPAELANYPLSTTGRKISRLLET